MLWDVLSDHVHAPSSVAEWEGISKEFWLRWNFLHCIGMSCKHLLHQHVYSQMNPSINFSPSIFL